MHDMELKQRVVRPTTRKYRDQMLALPGVTGIFTGEKKTRGEKTGVVAVVVTVEEKRPLSEISDEHRVPSTLDGVPTDVIQEGFSIPTVDANRYDPIEWGSSVGINGDSAYGTITAVVSDVATGRPMTMSAWHVYLREGAGDIGEPLMQPSYFDAGEVINYPDDWIGDVERWVLSDHVDGAVSFLVHRGASLTVATIGDSSFADAAAVSDAVTKHGRTTDTTTGVIAAIDASTTTIYPDPVGSHMFTDIIRIDPDDLDMGFIQPGDSGSPLLRTSDSALLGLCFAKTDVVAYACHIADVFSELGVEFYAGPHLMFSDDLATATTWTLSATLQLAPGVNGVAFGITAVGFSRPEDLNFSGTAIWGLANASAHTDSESCTNSVGRVKSMIGIEGDGDDVLLDSGEEIGGWVPNEDIDVTMTWTSDGTLELTATQGANTYTQSATGDTEMPAGAYIVFGNFAVCVDDLPLSGPATTLRNFAFSVS